MADKTAGPAPEIGEGPASLSFERCQLAKVYRALGHPARLAIIETLAKQNNACCGEIVDCLPLAQSTVSQHLQVLKETGLLTCQAKGRSCHYFLNMEILSAAASASDSFFSAIEMENASCPKEVCAEPLDPAVPIPASKECSRD